MEATQAPANVGARPSAEEINRATALHDLICNMLRSPLGRLRTCAEFERYAYNAGCALHNLPFALIGRGTVSAYQLREINELDPSAQGGWGQWVLEFCSQFGMDVPPFIDPKAARQAGSLPVL